MRTLTMEETEQVSGGLVDPSMVLGLVGAAPELAMNVAFGGVETALGAVDMATGVADLATGFL